MADKKEVKKEVKLNPINKEERAKLDFKSGDTVRVTSRIIEKDGKIRLQAFEGLVLSRKHGQKTNNAMFTVRKTASGVGVERIFPLFSPMVDKIEVIKRANTRRAKLYYIRDKAAKEIRRKMRSVMVQDEEKEVTPIMAEPAEVKE
ncbi:MAG: 50S ribosomal protein L19 [Candidatus Nomurabacteria bacterium GW2011_GWB1_37_5]|uniref:50S ribosomal protein L19 n=1 Tax=Candidatus Nomurabacteria bacterium GW2011_GWB1_37_5 TaxID=1618742 RepID=A0A0G0GXE7_9BACT|nr:MAG: 50S ribosomal protein L19 [Candidatus Nomurabacteria bacterium GW2011_GWB1_37_5]